MKCTTPVIPTGAQRLKVFAKFTQKLGSGKVAFEQGQALLLVFSGRGTVYVYNADATSDAVKRGIGLLYTYNDDTNIEVDGVRV